MAVRTISRDSANPRVVLVWPADVEKDGVKVNDTNAMYARGTDGTIVQPVALDANQFKAAFGFVPLTNSVGRYLIRKAHAPETATDKLTAGIKALVKQILDDEN